MSTLILKYISPITGKPCKTRPRKFITNALRRERLKEYILNQQKEWRKQHPTFSSEYKKAHPEQNLKHVLKCQHDNPDHVKARNTAKKIAKAETCCKCGSKIDIERHHPDYSKPLEIITLCRKCHVGVHSAH